MYNHPVTRKAILIGSQTPKGNFLPGVEGDLSYMKQFRMSPNGGAFHENEIDVLYDLPAKRVVDHVQNTIADYVTVYFSGHGYTSADGHRLLAMRDNDVEDLLLIANSPRVHVIVDACRTHERPGAAIGGINWYREKWLHADGYSTARALFDQWVMDSPFGWQVVHATGDNMYSYENRLRKGGRFTLALLDTVFTKQEGKIYKPLFMEEMVAEANTILQKQQIDQSPEIVDWDGFLKVPFAITSPQFIPNETRALQPIPVLKPQEDSANVLAICAGILLAGYCISKL
jgi:hypothetical protein